MRTIKTFFLSLIIVAGALVILIYAYKLFFYEGEMRLIEWRLNMIPNAEVVNIWGHKDVTLEEVTARIKVEGKGEIVLANLSKDVFNDPQSVPLISIGGYSFKTIGCYKAAGYHGRYGLGLGSMLNIGTASPLGQEIGIEFHSAADVIANYDKILAHVRSLKLAPEWKKILTEEYEMFLFVKEVPSPDRDPIYELFGVEHMAAFARCFPGPLTAGWNSASTSIIQTAFNLKHPTAFNPYYLCNMSFTKGPSISLTYEQVEELVSQLNSKEKRRLAESLKNEGVTADWDEIFAAITPGQVKQREIDRVVKEVRVKRQARLRREADPRRR